MVPPGKRPASIPGPYAEIGPETDPNAAIIKACSVVMTLPNSFIPVRYGDMNFETYWRISTEYCAWQYSPDGHSIWTSLFATAAAQSDPRKRTCPLPPAVTDSRYPGVAIMYLTIIHNHPPKSWPDNKMSPDDVYFLRQMVQEHYTRIENGQETVVFPKLNGREVPMRIVAFFGKSANGTVGCGGFYEYTWGTKEIYRVTQGQDGRWRKEPVEEVPLSDRN